MAGRIEDYAIIGNGFWRIAPSDSRDSAATELDAAVLLIPELGFLPGDDPRVVSGAETGTHRSAA